MSSKSSSLLLFGEQAVQSDILGNVITNYYPLTSLSSNGPIEFNIPGSVDEYIDLNDMNILIHAKILKDDGKNIDATDPVCFINQPISSLFEDAFLTIGDKQVEGGQHAYPYNGYLSSVLQFHPSAKKTHMASWGYCEDDPGEFDTKDNEGAKLRAKETALSKTWELMGPLFFDLTRQNRYLLPQTDVRIKLMPAKPEFVLQVYDASIKAKFKYAITKCVLSVRRVRVNDAVLSGHNLGLEKHNAKYHVNHISVTTFAITKGSQNIIKDRLFPSQTPKMLVVGMLEHAAFNGNFHKNPFNFQHFDLNKIALYRDGELVPGQIFTPNYEEDQFKQAYVQTMETLNFYNTDDSNGISLEYFKNGYNLYAFDLTADASCNAPHRSINYNSSLRLELNFEKVLAKTVNVMLFAVFDAKVEITKLRDVILSYNR